MKSEYADVLQRVRAYVSKQENAFDVWRPRWDLTRETPGSTNAASNGALNQLYLDQVQRALYQLVREGVLVKVNSGRDARYMTPEVRDRKAREAAEASERHADRVERYRAVRDALARAHFLSISSSQLDVRLELEDWERLVSQYLDDGGN